MAVVASEDSVLSEGAAVRILATQGGGSLQSNFEEVGGLNCRVIGISRAFERKK